MKSPTFAEHIFVLLARIPGGIMAAVPPIAGLITFGIHYTKSFHIPTKGKSKRPSNTLSINSYHKKKYTVFQREAVAKLNQEKPTAAERFSRPPTKQADKKNGQFI